MPDFRAKMHQKSISAGAPSPDPAGGAYSAPPDPLAAFKGPTTKGRGEGGKKGRGGGAIQFLASGRHRLSYATEQ